MNNTIITQVDYVRSPNAIQTSKNIIHTKVMNCSYFLTKYGNSRKKYDTARHIFYHQNMMRKIGSGLSVQQTRQDILLAEARAGRHYWQSIHMICKRDDSWKRTYPHAQDALNTAFNIGYRYLGQICKKALEDAGLERSLGILHSPALSESLVYDFMEIWRQIAVDSVVVPLFTRSRKASCNPAHIVYKMKEKLARKYRYCGEMVPLGNIISREAYALRTAIKNNAPWKPFEVQWGNSLKSIKISKNQ